MCSSSVTSGPKSCAGLCQCPRTPSGVQVAAERDDVGARVAEPVPPVPLKPVDSYDDGVLGGGLVVDHGHGSLAFLGRVRDQGPVPVLSTGAGPSRHSGALRRSLRRPVVAMW